MKRLYLLLGVAGAIAAPIAAHANRPQNDPSRPYYYSQPPLTAQQLKALETRMTGVESTIAAINASYGTHYMVMSEGEVAAMSHMAQANMEMGQALMELHESLASELPQYPAGS